MLPSGQLRDVGTEEGAAHGIGRRRLRAARIDFLDQRRGAEQVGEQHPFLAPLVAGMADIGEEFDHLAPVRLRRPQFADDRMEMRDRRRQDLRQGIVLRLRKSLRENVRRGGLAEIQRHWTRRHASPPGHWLVETKLAQDHDAVDDFIPI